MLTHRRRDSWEPSTPLLGLPTAFRGRKAVADEVATRLFPYGLDQHGHSGRKSQW